MPTLLERAEEYFEKVLAVKRSIKTIIEPVAPTAKVVPYFLYDPDPSGRRWAALLQSPKDGGRIHTICIWYDGLDFADPEFNTVMRSVRPLIPLGITVFHEFDGPGTVEDNVEDRMMKEMAIVQMTLAQHPLLDLDGITGHHGLRFPKINIIPLGEKQALSSSGRFRVQMDARKTTV